MTTRRQVLLGTSAVVAASALPAVMAETAIMPFADPSPAMTAAIKVYWDAREEIFRTIAIPFDELYITGDQR